MKTDKYRLNIPHIPFSYSLSCCTHPKHPVERADKHFKFSQITKVSHLTFIDWVTGGRVGVYQLEGSASCLSFHVLKHP